MLGAAFFLYFFLFFTWFGYRHILDKSILKDETTDLSLQGDALNPLPKGGILNIITLLTYDVAFHASDMRLRGRRGVCMVRKDRVNGS